MKKLLAYICVVLSLCFGLTGCGSPDEPFLMSGIERNFLKEEYNENYNHYEDKLDITKKTKTISVSGKVTSGAIDLKIIEKDKDGNDLQSYEYTITDILSETIELEKKHSENWVAFSDFDEQTDGGIKIDIFG